MARLQIIFLGHPLLPYLPCPFVKSRTVAAAAGTSKLMMLLPIFLLFPPFVSWFFKQIIPYYIGDAVFSYIFLIKPLPSHVRIRGKIRLLFLFLFLSVRASLPNIPKHMSGCFDADAYLPAPASQIVKCTKINTARTAALKTPLAQRNPR